MNDLKRTSSSPTRSDPPPRRWWQYAWTWWLVLLCLSMGLSQAHEVFAYLAIVAFIGAVAIPAWWLLKVALGFTVVVWTGQSGAASTHESSDETWGEGAVRHYYYGETRGN